MPASTDYREIPPPPELAAWVERFWTARRPPPHPGDRPDRVLPDGCIDLVFQVAGEGDPEAPEAAVAVGAMTRPLVLRHLGAIEHFGVRFRPGRASALLGVGAGELTDRRVALGELWRDGEALTERLLRASDAGLRVGALAAALTERLANAGDGADPCIDRAVAAIRRRRGAVRVDTLATWLGITRQHLARGFRERVGVSPKTFARVVRFQAALRAASDPRRPGWADIAAELGYSDQAHLVTEFRSLAGETPARWCRPGATNKSATSSMATLPAFCG